MKNSTVFLTRGIEPQRNTEGVKVVELKKLSWFKKFKKNKKSLFDEVGELPQKQQLSFYEEVNKNRRFLLLARF